ncbi:MAG TPA: glycosyltransferase family 4 protein [Mycobacteriales bacterium]|nr:glycosyltransferase family 4 protein [Mycobacteriales bacterium]
MTRTLVVTNDFPPRPGGIQAFVHQLALRQPAGSVVVYASTYDGAAAFDAAQPFDVVRYPTGLLLPTPDVLRRARAIARAEGCETVWFGAAAPLGLLARGLRAAGARRLVASTHGHETGWAMLPGARQLLRRIARDVDVVTYLGEYTRTLLARGLGQRDPGQQEQGRRAALERVPPGVDTGTFHPGLAGTDGAAVRRRLGLADRPTVVCVSRLVPRKGQDVLVRALPAIRARVPDAALLVVGGGPDLPRLRRLAAGLEVADHVVFTGAVPWEELPAHYAAGQVFAMPCRTRRAGLDVEGLGIVYLEASAVGLPVVAGGSGGAPDAVLPGQTGYVVNGRAVGEVAARVGDLLANPDRAAAMGRRGRAWVEAEWRWDVQAARLRRALSGEGGPAGCPP